MKRSLIIAMILIYAALAFGATVVSVRTQDYYAVAARVVIQIDKNAKYSVEPHASANSCEIRIFDTTKGTAVVQYQNSAKLINDIQLADKNGYCNVLIDIKSSYKVLNFTMEEPYRVVVDVIKSQASTERTERLGLARFYDDTQRYRLAGPLYSRLAVDYADDAEINYLWAKLLYRVGNVSKATKRAGMIPETSSYYKYAQTLLDRIERRVDPEAEPLEEPLAVAAQDSVAMHDTVAVASATCEPNTNSKNPFSNLVLYLLMAVAFLVGVTAVYGLTKLVRALLRKTPRPPVTTPDPEDSSADSTLEDGIQARMVSKLLSDGWTTKEIARELHISRKEVDRLSTIKGK